MGLVTMSPHTTSPTAGDPQRLTYEDWAGLLCAHFFRAEYDGVPVMFFVDDDAIANLHGGDPRDAVSSLVAAVRGRLDRGRPRQLFRRIESDARTWKVRGGEGPPPALPLLALAVLAATRMGRGRDRAAHNYYKPFCDLLGDDLDRELVVASYRDALPYLWHSLQWWLDDKHRGALGFSTIVEDRYFAYIGYADSQTLFSSSDRDKLTRFFRWIRLKPGERVDQTELMTYFRIWASRRDDLSEGTAHMLESEQYTAQLARIIKAAADRWRGVVRDDGRRGADILITLELFPRPRLGLVAERPDGFPPELACHGPLGQPVTLTSSHEGWYEELPVALSSSTLETGLRLTRDGLQLRLPPYNIHVLGKNADLGKWASVPQLSPGEPAWLLVRRPALDAVSTYLRGSARRGWKVIEREAITPRGWRLIGEVVIDAASDQEVPERLARVVPRVQNRFSLKGGLPLPRGSATYLTGGEPDVWLPPPPGDEDSIELQLDDELIEVPASATRIRLAERGLDEGAHVLRLEGIGRSLSTIRTLGQITPAADAVIAHALTRLDGSNMASSPGARSVDDRSAPGEIRVIGAVVEDPTGVLGEPPVSPLILPTGALRRVLVGARPGEVEEVPAPRKPPWMTRAGLGFQVFELMPSFQSVWIITEWNLAPSVRVRLKHAMPPAPAAPGTPEAAIATWALTIASSPGPAEPEASELWAAYQKAAADLGAA
jgi:hypothetical protein